MKPIDTFNEISGNFVESSPTSFYTREVIEEKIRWNFEILYSGSSLLLIKCKPVVIGKIISSLQCEKASMLSWKSESN